MNLFEVNYQSDGLSNMQLVAAKSERHARKVFYNKIKYGAIENVRDCGKLFMYSTSGVLFPNGDIPLY